MQVEIATSAGRTLKIIRETQSVELYITDDSGRYRLMCVIRASDMWRAIKKLFLIREEK